MIRIKISAALQVVFMEKEKNCPFLKQKFVSAWNSRYTMETNPF